MTLALGTVRPGSTILIPFNTFDSNDPSASVIVSAFVLADIGIYKGTSMTERGSTTGVVLLDTDGINIDAAVGIHGFTIDLSSNATDDFYVAGSRYYVTVGPVTVDAATVNFVAATFEIGYPGAILDGQIATLASQTSFTITNAPTDDSALVGCTVIIHDQASATQFATGNVSAYTTAANTVTLAVDPSIFTMAAGDNVSFFMPVNAPAIADDVWDEILTGSSHNIATSAGRRLRQLEEAFVLAEGVIATQTDGRTLTLDTGAVDTADFYIGARLQIEEGTGAGQTRIIVAYSAARVVLLDSVWTTNPDTNSRYSIVAADVHVSVSDADLTEGLVVTATSTTQVTLDSGALANADYYKETLIIFTHGTGAGQASHITGYTAGRVVTMSPALDTAVSTDTVYHIQAAVPISQTAKEVWDEAMVASTGAPAITGSMRVFMEWWATLSRNVVNQTATTTTVRNDADDGDISTSTVSDNGTTFVRGEFST